MKIKRHNGHTMPLLTVAITFAVIATGLIAMMAGQDIIITSQGASTEKRVEDLSHELLKEYNDFRGYDPHTISLFRAENQTSVVCAIDRNNDEILELHINFRQFNLHEPVSALVPELDRLFEIDTEELVMEYCKAHHIDYDKTPVSGLKEEELFDLIEKLQEETGVQL